MYELPNDAVPRQGPASGARRRGGERRTPPRPGEPPGGRRSTSQSARSTTSSRGPCWRARWMSPAPPPRSRRGAAADLLPQGGRRLRPADRRGRGVHELLAFVNSDGSVADIKDDVRRAEQEGDEGDDRAHDVRRRGRRPAGRHRGGVRPPPAQPRMALRGQGAGRQGGARRELPGGERGQGASARRRGHGVAADPRRHPLVHGQGRDAPRQPQGQPTSSTTRSWRARASTSTTTNRGSSA